MVRWEEGDDRTVQILEQKATLAPGTEGGGGDPSPPPWLTQTQHLFRQAPSKRANTQS